MMGLAIALLGLVNSPLNAQQEQQIDVRELTIKDGLSNGHITNIFQDKAGFLWIGTLSGLNRYDGYTIKTFFQGVHIRKIIEDEAGNLWVQEARAIHVFNPRTFETYPLNYDTLDVLSVRALTKHRDGHIFIVTDNALYTAVSSYEQPKKAFPFPPAMKAINLFGAKVKAGDELIWVRTPKGGLFELNKQGELIRHYFKGQAVNNTWVEDDTRIWVVSNGGLHYKLPSEKKFNRYRFPDDIRVHGMLRYSAHRYWVLHDTRYLKLIDTRTHEITDFSNEADFSYIDSYLGSTYGKDQVMWFGTVHGLIRMGITPKLISNFLPQTPIRSLYEDEQGLIYVGGYGRFYVLDPVNGKINPFRVKKRISADGKTHHFKEAIVDNKFAGYDMIHDDKNGFWMADEGAGVYHYDIPTQTIRNYRHRPQESLDAISLLKDKDGMIWVGTYDQLYTLNETAGRLEIYKNEAQDFYDHRVWALYQTSDGQIWIGTDKGLFQLNKTTGDIRSYSAEKVPSRLSHTAVFALHESPEGTLWIGTRGGGLNRLNRKTGEIHHFTKESHTLPDNNICSILEDDNGYLWLGSFNGLIRFDPRTGQVKTYTEHNGLTYSEFNHSAALKTRDGKLYFGGIQGLNAFDPDQLAKTKANSPVMLSAFRKYDGKKRAFVEIHPEVGPDKPIKLDYRDRSFTFQLALADYLNPKENQFAYRLLGLDTTWLYLDTNREVTLGTLPAGNFTLQVRARGSDGNWSGQQLHIPLHMGQAFYRTPAFIISVILASIALIYSMFRWRLQSLKQRQLQLENTVKARTRELSQQKLEIEKQAEELKSLDKLKSRFFANISHELRTPLTLISGPLGQWSKKSGLDASEQAQVAMMQRNSQNLLSLVDEVLDLSKLEANKLELHETATHFYPFFKRLLAAFESHAQSRQITFSMDYQADKNLSLLIDGHKVEKIINNLLSNAFKFTQDGGTIEVQTKEKEGSLSIAVADNGRGIHPDDLPYIFDRYYQSKQANGQAEGGTGIGLALSKALVTLMKGALTVSSEYGKGSRFTFTLPLKKAAKPTPAEREALPIPEEKAAQAEEPVQVVSENGHHQKTATVLIVEDHPDMQAFVQSILAPHYTLLTAANGKQALNLLERTKERPDLILSDVMMPEMDGMTLLETLKSAEKWRDLPVVMLTARAAQEDRLKALVTGVDDYLTKPFDAEELLARIRNLLHHAQLRRQWQQEQATRPELKVDFEETWTAWDTEWLQKAEVIVKREVSNPQFKVTDLAWEMAVSKSQLQRKLKDMTGLTPEQYIREVKLQKARHLLEGKALATVSEVAHAIGFDTPEYFSKKYYQRFGKRPTEYLTRTRA